MPGLGSCPPDFGSRFPEHAAGAPGKHSPGTAALPGGTNSPVSL
jgi:hypothetical protein